MINLRNSPFLWLALLLLLAFNLEAHTRLLTQHGVQLLIGLAMATCIYGALMKYNPNWKYTSTICISALVFLGGTLRQSQFKEELFPQLLIIGSMRMQGIVTVDQVLKNKETSISVRGRVKILVPVQDSMRWKYTDRFILVIIRDPSTRNLLPGDLLHLKGYGSPVQAPMNPYSFDARVYYSTIGIRHQLFCKGEDVDVELSKKFSFKRITAKWQAALSNLVRQHTSPEVSQVINALVWGDRSDMNVEVRDAFADSGAMHVLSVSGMHVAMIYSMLFLLLGAPGEGVFLKRILRFAAYAFAILLYVGLTGACPAVLRAGLMILLYLFGKAMGWNTQVWNLLGFAAFMMLWFNPYLYLNIGFQLSFLAMAGILLFAKPIIRSLNFKYKLAHWTWEIVALSLAAQVFIVAILLGQFHQFPLTFMISSIVAIPAGYIIIVGALLNTILSIFHLDFLWPLLDWSGHYFILSMKWMAALNPGMNYSMTVMAGWTLSTVAVIFSAALLYNWDLGRKIAYGFALLTILFLILHRAAVWKEKELVIYHSYKGLCIDIVDNGFCYSIQNASLSPEQIEFASRGYRCHQDAIRNIPVHETDKLHCQTFSLENQTLSFSNQHAFIFSKNTIGWKQGISYDYLVLDGLNSLETLDSFLLENTSVKIIMTAALPKKSKYKVLRFLNETHHPYHDIGQAGFYKIKL